MRSRFMFASGLLALVGIAGCLPPTQRELQMAQALQEMSSAVNEIRQGMSEMQDQLDSLRMVAVKQDSIVHTLANLAGVQIPR